MKYVEQIKSIVLVLLIMLSLALTFTVWNFKPPYNSIENIPTVDVALGESKNVEEVIQPASVLYHFDDVTTGTTEQQHLALLINEMKNWQIHDLSLIAEESSPALLKSYMHEPGRTLLQYPGLVPLPAWKDIIDITDESIPESSFDRLVIEWGDPENSDFNLYFINTRSGRVHQGRVSSTNLESFNANVRVPAQEYAHYITDEKIGVLPIYVKESSSEVRVIRYLQEDISHQRFVDGLFENPGSVVATGSLTNTEYSDESEALMQVNDNQKSINYIQPLAETRDPAIPSELIFNTVDWINGHSGWTNNYHYFGMQAVTQQIEYRLHVNNLPVFSTALATEMQLRWGLDGDTEQIFRYKRPYYVLESSVGESGISEMPSGAAVLDAISRTEALDPKKITAIIPAYELTRDQQEPERLMNLQPAWYYQMDGRWERLSNDVLGGDQFGLE